VGVGLGFQGAGGGGRSRTAWACVTGQTKMANTPMASASHNNLDSVFNVIIEPCLMPPVYVFLLANTT
jgi:hypothetical protein